MSIKYTSVTDRQTDTRQWLVPRWRIASRGKNDKNDQTRWYNVQQKSGCISLFSHCLANAFSCRLHENVLQPIKLSIRSRFDYLRNWAADFCSSNLHNMMVYQFKVYLRSHKVYHYFRSNISKKLGRGLAPLASWVGLWPPVPLTFEPWLRPCDFSSNNYISIVLYFMCNYVCISWAALGGWQGGGQPPPVCPPTCPLAAPHLSE